MSSYDSVLSVQLEFIPCQRRVTRVRNSDCSAEPFNRACLVFVGRGLFHKAIPDCRVFGGGYRLHLRAQRGRAMMWLRTGEFRSNGPQDKASGSEQAEAQSDRKGFCTLGPRRWAELDRFDARRKASEILLLVRRHGGWWSLRETTGLYVSAGGT